MFGGRVIGHLNATTEGNRVVIDYDYKNNGRGPTLTETITLSAKGLPSAWTVSGATTFGNKIDEQFTLAADRAEWRDSTGAGSAVSDGEQVYVPQTASPWSLGLFARLLDKTTSKRMPVLPSGTLTLKKGSDLTVSRHTGSRQGHRLYAGWNQSRARLPPARRAGRVVRGHLAGVRDRP